ncbi:MAG: hypothetical protein HOP12_01230 [Candidatus Eisenbacteria bacterium]|uniref:Uncharacterized protein n=1 Tax=Eiseniibacteriota bacterium TaxID=2212470 RepID=A0A849SU81_UNCEI|nr:hypothetical protein [Candidatus Eisenbacteria bacterium]
MKTCSIWLRSAFTCPNSWSRLKAEPDELGDVLDPVNDELEPPYRSSTGALMGLQ